MINYHISFQLNIQGLSSEVSRDEIHGMAMAESSSGDAASPLTARSIRLERVAQALALSQEELRRYDCLFRNLELNSSPLIQKYF